MDILDETNLMIDRREKMRPTFLSVLCIFTWLGSGFVIIQSIFMVIIFQGLATSSNRFLSSSSNEFGWMFYSYLSSFICAIGCIVGAILMWKLKRMGFFIYLISELIPILLTAFIWLGLSSSSFIGSSILWIFISSLIPIAFIVMYSLNLKHLK